MPPRTRFSRTNRSRDRSPRARERVARRKCMTMLSLAGTKSIQRNRRSAKSAGNAMVLIFNERGSHVYKSQRIAILRRGDEVSFVGKITNVNALNLELEDCELTN